MARSLIGVNLSTNLTVMQLTSSPVVWVVSGEMLPFG